MFLRVCPVCRGERRVVVGYETAGAWLPVIEPCPTCDGEGLIRTGEPRRMSDRYPEGWSPWKKIRDGLCPHGVAVGFGCSRCTEDASPPAEGDDE